MAGATSGGLMHPTVITARLLPFALFHFFPTVQAAAWRQIGHVLCHAWIYNFKQNQINIDPEKQGASRRQPFSSVCQLCKVPPCGLLFSCIQWAGWSLKLCSGRGYHGRPPSDRRWICSRRGCANLGHCCIHGRYARRSSLAAGIERAGLVY